MNEEIKKNTSEEEKVKRLIFRMKPTKILLSLLQDKKLCISDLARESNQTYVYATRIIKYFEKSGLITIEKEKKKKIVKLTNKGEKVSKTISELLELL